MSSTLFNLHPPFTFPIQQTRISLKSHYRIDLFRHKNSQLQFFNSNRRFHHPSSIKSVSVNGYPVKKEEEGSLKRYEEGWLKKWVEFVRYILPGGEWWRLSNEGVDGVIVAKPVTVLVALKRMWELIAQDRWLIFTAFAALILAAVSLILYFFIPCNFFSSFRG